MIHSFEPIVDENSRILILGTMPGEESLRRQQYYGYSRNAFWKLLFEIFGEEITDEYDMKKELLLRHNIALWDVLKSCERETSSDSMIKDPIVNDFIWMFRNHTGIRRVFFNGKKAEQLFKRYVLHNCNTGKIIFVTLPSTSPANTQSYGSKLTEWRIIKEAMMDI